MPMDDEKKPVVLLLQGPLSSFYSDVAGALLAEGIQFFKIHFCGSDLADWHHDNGHSFSGKLEDWEAFFAEFASHNHVTDFVMHGDRRPYHKIAVEWAKRNGINIWVTELGYLRPDWITFEPDGTSRHSTFPRDPSLITKLAEHSPDINSTRQFHDQPFAIILQELRWTVFNLLYLWKFPNFVTHRNQSPFRVYSGWLISRLTKRIFPAQQVVPVGRYFVMALQLEGDYQLRDHSPFESIGESVEFVIASFAKHAAPDVNLIMKLHPHEFNKTRLKKTITRLGQEYSISDRLQIVEDTPIGKLSAAAEGFVTVNSSAGFEALEQNCPTHTIAQTLYGIEGLTFQGALDEFWNNNEAPDPALFDNLKKLLCETRMVRGSIYSADGRIAAASAIAKKLAKANS